MQIINNTPFPSIGWPSTDAQDITYITSLTRVKYLFDTLDSDGLWHLKLDQDQGTFFIKDTFYDNNPKKIHYESDFIPYKRQADLVLHINNDYNEFGHCGVEVIRYSPFGTQKDFIKKPLLKHMSLKNLGFISRADKIRMQWVGTLNQKWIETKAPVLPNNFNESYYNAVHPKMQLPQTYFEPGDVITLHKLLRGVHQQSVIVPGVYLTVMHDTGVDKTTTLLDIDTLIFDIENTDMRKNAMYVSYRNRSKVTSNVKSITFDMLLEKSFIEKGEVHGR